MIKHEAFQFLMKKYCHDKKRNKDIEELDANEDKFQEVGMMMF